MLSSCVFSLENENATYFAGDIIRGSITLTIKKIKKITNISLVIHGYGKVRFELLEPPGRNMRRKMINYEFSEVYVNDATVVRGAGVLPAGIYNYTICAALPATCPTSIEGQHGHIRYELSLVINREPTDYPNIFKKAVTVLKKVDLNSSIANKVPLVVENITTSCCCFGGTILYGLKLPYSAYAPGQTVRHCFHIENTTMEKIDGYLVQVIKKMSYTARTPRLMKLVTEDVLETSFYRLPSERGERHNMNHEFIVPPVPSTTSVSSIIHVEYFIKVIVRFWSCSSDSELIAPLVIGTTPLRQSLIRENLINAELNIPPYDWPENDDEIEPMNYVLSKVIDEPFVDKDEEEVNRITNFRPHYPMYCSYYPVT